MNPNLVFVGAGGILCAIDRSTGDTVWKFKFPARALQSGGFVNLLVAGDLLYAHALGELHCIRAATGELLWTNPLTGMGYGLGTIAVEGQATSAAAAFDQQRVDRSQSNAGHTF